MEKKKCENCGELFERKGYIRNCIWIKRKYCSDVCANKSKKQRDITGQKFNKLTAIKFDKRIGDITQYNYFWIFKCDCGTIKSIDKSKVILGYTTSCGCVGRLPKHITHGFKHSSFYNRFCSIKARCNNKNDTNFKNYGGRGIKCLWKTFEEFRDDMYKSFIEHIDEFGNDNTSIDRINNDGNYELGNCKWSTWIEQANNKRTTKK